MIQKKRYFEPITGRLVVILICQVVLSGLFVWAMSALADLPPR